MSTNESFATFMRAFEARRHEFMTKLNEFPVVLSRNDHRAKVEAARTLQTSAHTMKAMLSQNDWPAWLQPIEGLIQGVANSGDNQIPIDTASKYLIDLIPQARAHPWNFRESQRQEAIDFDAIYNEAFATSELPGLFDQLVQGLDKIIESGHVDSLKALHALEKLIATLRRSKAGSFASKVHAYWYAKTFVRHLLWNTLEAIPGLALLTKSVRDTVDEMKSGFDEVNGSVKLQIESATTMEMPMLEVAPTRQRSLPAPMGSERTDRPGPS